MIRNTPGKNHTITIDEPTVFVNDGRDHYLLATFNWQCKGELVSRCRLRQRGDRELNGQ